VNIRKCNAVPADASVRPVIHLVRVVRHLELPLVPSTSEGTSVTPLIVRPLAARMRKTRPVVPSSCASSPPPSSASLLSHCSDDVHTSSVLSDELNVPCGSGLCTMSANQSANGRAGPLRPSKRTVSTGVRRVRVNCAGMLLLALLAALLATRAHTQLPPHQPDGAGAAAAAAAAAATTLTLRLDRGGSRLGDFAPVPLDELLDELMRLVVFDLLRR